MNLTLYTDAAMSGRFLGLAAVLVADGRELTCLARGCVSVEPEANTMGEFAAVAMGLSLVKAQSRCLVDLTVFTDCQATATTLSGQGKCRAGKGAAQAARRLMRQYRSVSVRWIRGHGQSEFNNRCDQLAGQAMRAQRNRRCARRP